MKRQQKINLSDKKFYQALYKKSYYHFFKDAFSILKPKETFRDGWHYRYICQILQDEVHRIARREPSNYDIIIVNVPPRTGKSFMVARCLNAWAWTLYPHLNFVTSSYSAALSVSHALDTRRLIRSVWYQKLYGNIYDIARDQDVKSRFDTDHSGMRFATSVGGTLTGEGGDIIIVDDPVDPKQADSEVERKAANRWWDETFFNRLNDAQTGVRIVVMQRLHQQDLTGHIMEKKGPNYRILHICLPGKKSEQVRPIELKANYQDDLLFPSKLNQAELDKQKKSLGPYGYAGQIMQKPTPEGGGRIKRDWFTIMRRNQLPESLPKFTYVDASEGKPNSDEMAAGCWSIYKGKIIIWEILSVRETFNQFIGARDESGKYVGSTYDEFLIRNGCDRTTYNFWEAKSLGQGYVDYINANVPSVNAIPDDPGSDSKETRAFREIPTMYAGNVLLVEGEWNEAFLDQVGNFPKSEENGQVDVLSSIIRKSDLSEYEEEKNTKNKNREAEKEDEDNDSEYLL